MLGGPCRVLQGAAAVLLASRSVPTPGRRDRCVELRDVPVALGRPGQSRRRAVLRSTASAVPSGPRRCRPLTERTESPTHVLCGVMSPFVPTAPATMKDADLCCSQWECTWRTERNTLGCKHTGAPRFFYTRLLLPPHGGLLQTSPTAQVIVPHRCLDCGTLSLFRRIMS